LEVVLDGGRRHRPSASRGATSGGELVPSGSGGVPAAAGAAAAPAPARRSGACGGAHQGGGRDPQQRVLRAARRAGMRAQALLVAETELELVSAAATDVLVDRHGPASPLLGSDRNRRPPGRSPALAGVRENI